MLKGLWKRMLRFFGGAPEIWLVSDFHFDHANIIKYCDRPFTSVEEMNKELIRRYNSLVKKQDSVYILGDVGFKNPKRTVGFVQQLNGKKFLVRGNHDGQFLGYLKKKDIKLFEWVKTDYILSYKGLNIFMNHYPTENIGTADLIAHGHIHQRDSELKVKSINACVERWNYYPVSLDEAIHGTK